MPRKKFVPYLENDAERELFEKLHLNNLEFVLNVYEERIRDLKLKEDIVTKNLMRQLVSKLLENNSVEITPADKRKFDSILIKEKVKNREMWRYRCCRILQYRY